MRKVFLPGIVMALGLGSSVASLYAQYQIPGQGLAGSAYPIQGNNQFGMTNPQVMVMPASQAPFVPGGQATFASGGQPYYVPGSQVPTMPVSSRSPVLYAQNDVGTGASGHVHVPAGGHSLGQNASEAYSQPLPSPVASEYATVPASGTTSYAPTPQPHLQGMGGGTDGGYPAQAGCSSCASGDSYSFGTGPTYSTGFGPAGCGNGYATCGAPQIALSVVSPKPWIFGANALVFTRIDNEHVRFASDSNMPSRPLLTTNEVDFGQAEGFELFGGWYFGCGRYALIASYWSLFADPQMAQVDFMPGVNQRTNLPFVTRGVPDPNSLYGLTLPVGNLYSRYDMTNAQRLRRDQDFQNFELNVFSFALGGAARAGLAAVPVAAGCGDCGPCGTSSCGPNACIPTATFQRGPTSACGPIFGAKCSKLRFSPLLGFRWFRFDDDLEYAASYADTMFGSGPDDVYYRNNITNNLFGFQMGGLANYCVGKRLSLQAGLKGGIYGNHITAETFAGHIDRPATVMSQNSYVGMPYSFTSSVTDVAFIGEGNLGVGVCLGKGWSANIGYRFLGVGGVATAPGQIPRDFGLLDDAKHIQRSHALMLHGFSLGAAYNW